MQERRKSPRRRVLKVGKIIFNDMQCLYDCRIRNISGSGARLRLDNPWLVPSRFEFHEVTATQRHAARVVWRDDSEIGIAFA